MTAVVLAALLLAGETDAAPLPTEPARAYQPEAKTSEDQALPLQAPQNPTASQSAWRMSALSRALNAPPGSPEFYAALYRPDLAKAAENRLLGRNVLQIGGGVIGGAGLLWILYELRNTQVSVGGGGGGVQRDSNLPLAAALAVGAARSFCAAWPCPRIRCPPMSARLCCANSCKVAPRHRPCAGTRWSLTAARPRWYQAVSRRTTRLANTLSWPDVNDTDAGAPGSSSVPPGPPPTRPLDGAGFDALLAATTPRIRAVPLLLAVNIAILRAEANRLNQTLGTKRK